MHKKHWLLLLLIFILALTAACGSDETPIPAEEAQSVEEAAPPATEETIQEDPAAVTESESDFPLPEDVDSDSVRHLGDGAINFETSLNLPDAINFYFSAFIDLEYKERRMLTVITDSRFSMVFDGHPSGKAIIIQGTAFDGGVKIDLRLEDI